MSFDEFGERLTGKFAIPDGQAQLYERGATMRKGGHMRRKLMWVLAVGGVTLVAASYVTTVVATPASGFTSTSLAVGRLAEFDIMHKLVWDDPDPTNSKKNVWHSTQKTKGDSDLYVQSNVWVPGGTSGWHTHPGHSLITVTAGTVTAYKGDDPTCAPKVYTVGMTFVDEGEEHVHVIRNEGAVEARTVTVQLLPAGATRRIDAPANPACTF